jgi:hypothetical protein
MKVIGIYVRPFVILQGLEHGNKFFTDHKQGDDPTKLLDGTVAYKVLGYADTVEQAQVFLYGRAYPLDRPRAVLTAVDD